VFHFQYTAFETRISEFTPPLHLDDKFFSMKQLTNLLLLMPLLLAGQSDTIILDNIEAAEILIDLTFTDEERELMRPDLEEAREDYRAMRTATIDNAVPMALDFNPVPPGVTFDTTQEQVTIQLQKADLPENLEHLAFYSVSELAYLIKNGELSSTTLTKIYLDRLKKYGDTLQCVITITEDVALAQAERADKELAVGNYRGPLHGIPYGVKDLFAVKGFKTTWGAMPYKDQIIDETATVVRKLEEAGAVLVAKLTLGALAMGDVWYGGTTKNPWNLEQGSSGSSAGSASATVAGLVGFSIGTETLGSIVSPSTRCGASGLRPTFGRVSRAGGMALSWSMDKVGPICRTAEDCALVFQAIHGADGIDRTAVDMPFNYKSEVDIKDLRIGYIKEYFEADYWNKTNDSLSLEVLRASGTELIPMQLPQQEYYNNLRLIIGVESAAAFDALTRSNQDSLLVRQNRYAWPNIFRQSRFVPAVEYIQANRLRMQLCREMHEAMKDFDVIVTPSYGGNQLLLTNLSGHPCVVVPNGFTDSGSPTSISFIGNLYDEAKILALAKLFQQSTDYEIMRPDGF